LNDYSRELISRNVSMASGNQTLSRSFKDH
jgi:hypothetical protein